MVLNTNVKVVKRMCVLAPVTNLIYLSSKVTHQCLLCNRDRKHSAILLYSECGRIPSSKAEGIVGDRGFSTAMVRVQPPELCLSPSAPQPWPNVEITFPWSSWHRCHMFKAQNHCPSFPWNLFQAIYSPRPAGQLWPKKTRKLLWYSVSYNCVCTNNTWTAA